jgi:hypothetical protein
MIKSWILSFHELQKAKEKLLVSVFFDKWFQGNRLVVVRQRTSARQLSCFDHIYNKRKTFFFLFVEHELKYENW